MGLSRAGRPRGAKTKKTDLHAKCQEMGVDVFTELLQIASEEEDPNRKFNKFIQLAQYLYAKPKDELNLNQFSPEEIRDYLISLVKNVEPSAS